MNIKEKWHESIADNSSALEICPTIIGAFKDRSEANEIIGRKEDAKADKRNFVMLMSKKATEGDITLDD